MRAEAHTFCCGCDEIAFRLVRRDRTTLAISVEPDLGVEVVAPKDAPLDKIVEGAEARAVDTAAIALLCAVPAANARAILRLGGDTPLSRPAIPAEGGSAHSAAGETAKRTSRGPVVPTQTGGADALTCGSLVPGACTRRLPPPNSGLPKSIRRP